jgi:thioredoxin
VERAIVSAQSPQGFPRCPRCKSELPWLVDADAETFAAETSASVPVVVDFWAAWCGPCRVVAPVLEEIASERPDLRIVKLDIDENPQTAARFQVLSIPTMILFKGGQPVKTVIGAYPKKRLEQELAPALEAA